MPGTRIVLLLILLFPAVARAQEEVTNDNGVLVLHRTYGRDMPVLSPDGKTLAICGDEKLRFVNPFTGLRVANFEKHKSYPSMAAWLPNGKAVVTLGDWIVFWNGQGHPISEIKPGEFAQMDREPTFVQMALSSDNKSIAIGLNNGDIIVTEISNRTNVKRLNGGHNEYVSGLIWRDNQILSSGGYGDGNVCIWNADDGKQLKKFQAHDRNVRAMALLPDDKSLVTLGEKADVVIWNLESGEAAKRFPTAPTSEIGGINPGAIGILSEGKVIAATQGKEIGLWTIDGKPITRLTGHNETVRALNVSANGQLLVSTGGDTTRIWKVKDLPGKNEKNMEASVKSAAAKMTQQINQLKNWEIGRGDWKQQGRSIIGSGNSRINFPGTYPNDFTFSCKLKVHGDTNPRVRFGSFHFGYEGRQPRFFLHGSKAEGEFLPFEFDREYAIKVQVKGDTATLWIDGQQIAQSHPKQNDQRFLSIEGGGIQSQGSSEYFDLKIEFDDAR
ncbi:hypothetical protein C5Y96_07570 [Blastopirellula marina]|uniref:Anaphase-promoting complex subunit 4-like WD40 domain-containing protein n=1 Tax=Blastopirellula marina TaxID=124 RepID=A0A2S8FXV3_9BACT|nr:MULTISPECIES: hypothetical protein [Pirellulaceae]PQO37009.1 hypothetical protein C5Y96_07570 [Blastopirellula marina]RCS53724.1 hypothetical protein DTL36_07580 [Bremerella cremea]